MVYQPDAGAVMRAFRLISWFCSVGLAMGWSADPLRVVSPVRQFIVTASSAQPADFRYTAFPTLLRTGEDEVWIAYKAGRTHATDAGSAIEVVRHTLSSGETVPLQRMRAPEPKLYQMAEFVRFPDDGVALYLDVQDVGWDARHYRSGAEVIRWDKGRREFAAAVPLGAINTLTYGYPLEFVTEGRTTWQLIMSFGYHQPGGRWGVDTLRSEDAGRGWSFVRNLTEEFGGIRANESGFAAVADGFIVATRGYDRVARLHRTDRDFRVRRQVDLTGKTPFVHSYIGRPRVWVRDGHGYLLGRNWTRPTAGTAARAEGESEMQLCLLRFDLETLAVTSCVVLDNADQQKVTDGYYAVPVFTGQGEQAILHVVTYKGMNQRPPDIVRLDYRWADVK